MQHVHTLYTYNINSDLQSTSFWWFLRSPKRFQRLNKTNEKNDIYAPPHQKAYRQFKYSGENNAKLRILRCNDNMKEINPQLSETQIINAPPHPSRVEHRIRGNSQKHSIICNQKPAVVWNLYLAS